MGNMDKEKVFVSSVMQGFTDQRLAAKSAIELLRLQPVMAEDFGAKPHSSQRVCLEGVKGSDILVLILGRRYGFVAQSGKAVTEEEFDCARARGLPVLVFVERVQMEHEQEDFVRRLKSYEEGYHVSFFASPDQLKDSVVQALNDQLDRGMSPSLDASGARANLDRHYWGAKRPDRYETGLGAVVFPARQQQYISAITLGQQRFQDTWLKEAMFGDARLFVSDHGILRGESDDSTIFSQSRDHGLVASLQVHCDGTLTFTKSLGQQGRSSLSLVRSMVIDEDEFRSALLAFLKYANWFYGSLEEGQMLTTFFFGGSLSGLNSKSFGRIPPIEPNRMGMPMHGLRDPLSFPKEPYKLSRADLIDGENAATEITELVARTFRAARAYYTAENT